MAIFKSAYDTLGANYYRDIPRTMEHVLTAFNFGDLFEVRPGVFCVNNRSERSGSIPVFNYPLIIKTKSDAVKINYTGSSNSVMGRNDELDVISVFDARPYLTTIRTHADNIGSQLNVRDMPKFQAQVLLAQMALMWHQGEVTKIQDLSDLPFSVFAWWLSETLGKRYTLDNNYQVQLCALAAIWFQSNFTNLSKGDVDSKYKAELISMITRVVGLRIPDLEDIVEQYPVINQISEFIAAAKELTGSRKLIDLNESVFTTAIGGSWFGAIGKEQIVVACEYPPQWITMVLQSLIDRGYKQAPLTRITERNMYKKMQDSFGREVGKLSEFNLSY